MTCAIDTLPDQLHRLCFVLVHYQDPDAPEAPAPAAAGEQASEEQERRRAIECERRGGWYVGTLHLPRRRGVTRPSPVVYHLTGPQSENMHFFAQEYSKVLGRKITFADIPVEPWRDGLLKRGFPVHLVNHLATMADLHRAGRYNRMSDDVLTLTGQGPLSVQEFVRKHAATFTAPSREA